VPGAVRASAGLSTTTEDIDRFLAALTIIARNEPGPVEYRQDPRSGDFQPLGDAADWWTDSAATQAGCSRS